MTDRIYATPLNSLPPELHDYIFQLACEDSYFPTPAISLSRVSHYWNNLTRPHRYTVIHLNFKHLHALLDQLFNLPPDDRRVRTVQITDDFGDDSGEFNIYMDSPQHGILYQTYFIHFLTLVSPTLRSLSIRLNHFVNATPSLEDVWSTQFPELEILEVKGCYPFPKPPPVKSQANSGNRRGHPTTNFPRLETLTLDGISNPYGLLREGILDASIPNLKILDIRGVRCAPLFVPQIRGALSDRITQFHHANHTRGAIPPKLQSLYLTVDTYSNEARRDMHRIELAMRDHTLSEIENFMDFIDKVKWKEGRKVSVKLVRRLNGASV